MKSKPLVNYEDSQVYRLGKLYKLIGDTLMNPETTIAELANLGKQLGFDITMELVPKQKTRLTEG